MHIQYSTYSLAYTHTHRDRTHAHTTHASLYAQMTFIIKYNFRNQLEQAREKKSRISMRIVQRDRLARTIYSTVEIDYV